jgi:hypothetical protein
MNEDERRSGVTALQVAVIVALILVIVAGIADPMNKKLGDRAFIMASSSNARQIVAALKLYASDHGGSYPDAELVVQCEQTANAAFRELIKFEILQDEKIFTSKNSKFKGDNDIGRAPYFNEALESGENHWAMTIGCNDSSPGNVPVVFENPAVASWPPAWDVNKAGQPARGRAWKGGKVIVASNDGSVEAIQLDSMTGDTVKPANDPVDGKNVFTRASAKGEILDIEAD